VLGRDVDEGGMKTYKAAIRNGRFNRDDLLRLLKKSDEAQQLM